ncbi:DUF2249 domain-containing protein [Mesorhizobium sp.]|uniref:DUF2249 domain-containing protein n=1 Tax=Mesorhizobium sp. TaxID=1871066 RepID=UPI000FE574FB|nr:DUF2249 domain-containing protein [Mesorhizobium sp.]RWB26209.1 MAG: DUF2249 domain-containing protein [Mesorhizobium sp.]
MTTIFVELDVRPILAAGGEPFGKIMETVAALAPGEELRLLAPFRPVPLFQALGSKGFSHEDREIGNGDWEVLFRRAGKEEFVDQTASASVEAQWPDALMHLDNRDLEPPEPMVRILEAIEAMQPGEVLSALLCREPIFLLPELDKRGHDWRGGFDRDGTTYRLLVRIGARSEAAE